MNLNHLAYFKEAVSCKSINKAAKNLYISQPALTLALRTFENEIGVKLLIRSHAGIFPTEAGQQIYEDSCQILQIISNWSRYNTEGKMQYIKFQLFSSPFIYNTLIHNIILDIVDTYPKFDVFPLEMNDDDIFQTIKEQPDFAIGISSVPKNQFEIVKKNEKAFGLEVEYLFQDYFCVFINIDHPMASKKLLTPEDLQHLTLTGYVEDRQIDQLLKPLFNQNRYYRQTNQGTIMQMVKENKSAAIFPKLLAQYGTFSDCKKVKAIPIKYKSDILELYYVLIYKSGKNLSDEKLQILQIIKNFFIHL